MVSTHWSGMKLEYIYIHIYIYRWTLAQVMTLYEQIFTYHELVFWGNRLKVILRKALLNLIRNTCSEITLFKITGVYYSVGNVICFTHWGRVTHICVSKLTIIGSDNGLSPGWRQAIIETNDGILLIGPLGTNFSEMLIKIHTFSFKKIHLKMSSGIWRPFCLGLNVLWWWAARRETT